MKKLSYTDVYAECATANIAAPSTKTLEPLEDIVGQERAQEAVRFAMAMPGSGYNIYAIGRTGLGKRTMILRYLKNKLTPKNHVSDWCYVVNFDEPRSPKILKLPVGFGAQLKKDMEAMISRLAKAIPQAFDNDSYYERAEKLKTEYAEIQEQALEKFAAQTKKKGVQLSVTTPGGYRLTALNGDEPHTVDTFAALSQEEQDKFDVVINKLEVKLRSTIRQLAAWEQEFVDKQQALNEEVVVGVSKHHVDDLLEKYGEQDDVVSYLKRLQQDLIDNFDVFLEEGEEQAALADATLDKKLPRRYQINVLVNHSNNRPPVVVEENPNYHNLFGYVESVTYKGSVFTDFSLIRSGSVHRANGGYLLIDAAKVLEQPFVWDGLKRALRSRSLQVNSLEREVTLSGTISLDPEAMPLDLKVILLGDRETYLLLQHYDPEFTELFKVAADFENEMPRTPSSESHYAQFISSLVHEKSFLHCDRKAIARVIEHSSRQAEDQSKLSLHASDIANLLRESNYWAQEQSSNMIRCAHVERALESNLMRNSRIKDQMFHTLSNGSTLLSVEGAVIGQINALSVLSTGGAEFGMPNRVTANCYFGDGDIIDIEHNARLGGNIHTKGVMILSSYLSTLFAKYKPMPLSASIAFEQSYGEVDGDSASLAELCALVSSLGERPIKQNFAVTGSVNQFGEVQPVGGVNEKIEGFFDACEILGLTGEQAVILPSTNQINLMLSKKVRDAIKAKRFHIYTVERVDEALELLLGEHPGVKDKDGNYPVRSMYGSILQKFDALRTAENEQEGA
ncbi:MAG: AAA family ATPase [Oleiphilaceae bacterium]|nr:AAA family ATPase [Oleiphilaceae bacterium]